MRFSGASFVGPLDDYTSGLKIAWDVRRRLLSSYTGALCEVRADRSGQPTFDVQAKSDGTWDTAALLSFAGSDSCYVTQVYDQSGNGRHISNTNAATQPMLVNAGSLLTDGPLFTSAGGQNLTIGSLNYLDVFGTNQFQVVCRMTNDGAPGSGRAFLMGSVLTYFPWEALGNIYFDSPDRIQIATPADILDVECVASFERFTSNIANMRRNGTVVCTGASTTALSSGTAQFFYGFSFEGHLPSMVIWNTADATVAPLRAAALP
jgi:hypothetical protein